MPTSTNLTLVAMVLVLGAASTTASADTWPPAVERALDLAGENRGELVRVLEHCAAGGDVEALRAAEFLIANMEGHGYSVNRFFDEQDDEVEFDALDYPNYKQARAAFEALEKTHGPIHYGRKEFVEDLKSITADFLIENIDLALTTWRESPWARGITFDAFCEHILPYRCSNEPLDPWRPACRSRLAGLTAELKDPEDPAEVARTVRKQAKRWVRFSELYYLHPTDQGFDEMLVTRTGRCEDMSNMLGYAFRATGVVAAQDYTPYWANRDNNHAWTVILDGEGRGRAGLAHRAAKVYRKTYSIQPEALGTMKAADETVPRWLGGRNYRDVTDQYLDTTDVTVELTEAPPEGTRFAYLCVFNGGDWRAIHWGRIEDENIVSFDRMGRNIACLPAYYDGEKLVPAATPLIVVADGTIRTLDGAGDATIEVTLAAKAAGVEGAINAKPGVARELLVWEGGWRSLGRRTVEDGPVVFEGVPAGRLYWLPADGNRNKARIFTIDDGRKRRW